MPREWFDEESMRVIAETHNTEKVALRIRISELEAALKKIMERSGDPETHQIAKAVLRKSKS